MENIEETDVEESDVEEAEEVGFPVHRGPSPSPNQKAMAKYGQNVLDQLFTTPESKREDFRLYLEHTQIMDALSRFFVQLYDETGTVDAQDIKPEKVLTCLIENISTILPIKARLEGLRLDVENLHQRFAVLEQENQRLRENLQIYEPPLISHEEEFGEFEWLGEQEEGGEILGEAVKSLEKLEVEQSEVPPF